MVTCKDDDQDMGILKGSQGILFAIDSRQIKIRGSGSDGKGLVVIVCPFSEFTRVFMEKWQKGKPSEEYPCMQAIDKICHDQIGFDSAFFFTVNSMDKSKMQATV
jgi:hypothetical protein